MSLVALNSRLGIKPHILLVDLYEPYYKLYFIISVTGIGI